jgi:hypothetical protein
MSGSITYPFGAGPFGVGPWPPYSVVQIAGLAVISFGPTGQLIETWAIPTQMCETGTWTATTLPSGPPNDPRLEVVA